ncbi:MAG: response regulator [Campylobacterota bacterium]|nr:response regulator [Campylobacterota bacterium]
MNLVDNNYEEIFQILRDDDLEDFIEFSHTVKVLYIDKDSEMMNDICDVFKIFFHQLDIAYNGEEGLELFKQNRYDLIITAIDIPKMNGIDLITAIRKISRHITILTLTTEQRELKDLIDLIRLGIDGHILIPIEVQQFVGILQKVLDTLKNKQGLYEYRINLELMVKEKTKELQKYLDIINKHILISTTDLNGVIIYANEAFSTTSGYTKEELIGKSQNIIRHPDMPKSIFKDMWSSLQNGQTWRGKIKNIKKDGNYYWVDAVISPNFDKNGNIDSYNAVRINITDKMKLEELTQLQEQVIMEQVAIANNERDKAQKYAKAKSDFLANMSHEIRTPLNAILGFVELLKEDETDKVKQNYLTIVDRSSKSLLSIINDILDFSKIENEKIDIDSIDFESIVEFETIAELFKAKAKEKDIDLIINIDENIPKYLNSDIQKLRQIISNLLSNAIKFTKNSKKVELYIYYENGRLFVSVKDEGIGIKNDRQKVIFDAFSQADISTTRKFGGTGLGLSISNAYVQKLGGTLELESKENIGSRFHFSIPCKIGEKVETTNKVKESIDIKGKLLVVEDNKANQMFMKVILKKMNLKLDIANDGVEAVQMYKNNSYDIILMDENMPNMNGIEATKQILEYEKENNFTHIPIVALTANALKGDRKRFLDAGMDEYLTKPLDKNKLREVLIKLIH